MLHIQFASAPVRWLILCVVCVSSACAVNANVTIDGGGHRWAHFTNSRLSEVAIERETLTKALCHVVREYYVEKVEVAVFMRAAENRQHYDDQSDLIGELLQRLNTNPAVAVLLEDWPHLPHVRPRYFVIFFIDSYQSFWNILSHMRPLEFGTSGFYTIVLTHSITENRIKVMRTIFSMMWSRKFTNVNIVLSNVIHSSHIRIMFYTYFPYTPDLCNSIRPHLNNIFVNDSFIMERPTFPLKLYNMHRCPIRVGSFHTPPFVFEQKLNDGTTEWTGIDIMLVRMIADALNFSPTMLVPPDGEKWGFIRNNTFYGGLKLIIDGAADFIIGSYIYTYAYEQVLSASITYFHMESVLLVPPGRPFTSYEMLYMPFGQYTWLCVLLIFLIGAIVIVLLQRRTTSTARHFVYGHRNRMPLLNFVIVTLGGGVDFPPLRVFGRTMLMIWLLAALVLRSIYQGGLFSFIQDRRNISSIDTVADLLDSDFMMYISRQAAQTAPISFMAESRRIYIPISDIEPYYTKITDSSFPGVMVSSDVHTVHRNQMLKPKVIYMARERLGLLQLSIYMQRNSFLAHPFDEKILDFQANGLMIKASRTFIDSKIFETHRRQPRALSIIELRGCFGICMGLACFAFVIFICEIIARKFTVVRRVLEFVE